MLTHSLARGLFAIITLCRAITREQYLYASSNIVITVCLMCHLRFFFRGVKSDSTSAPWFSVSMMLAAAAMLAKEHGVTVLGVCLLYDVFIVSWPTVKRYVTIWGPLIKVLHNAYFLEVRPTPFVMLITLEHAPL